MGSARGLAKEWPFLVAFLLSAGLIARFGAHDLWIAADEGVYAHTTQRCLEGDLPHRDFRYLHPGLYLWLDMLAFKLAGADMSALRWPAIWANLGQAVVVYALLRPEGRLVGALGVLWVGAVGLPAIPSPSASVICTAFCLAALWVSARPQPWESRRVMLLLGWFLGMAFLCRQLGAAYLGCGLLSWALSTKATQDTRASVVGRLLLLLSMLAVLVSVWRRTDAFGTLVFVAGPVLLTLQALVLGRPSSAVTYRLVSWVGAGFALAFLPVVLVYGYLGIADDWFRDVFVLAFSATDVGFATMYRYSDLFYEVCAAVPAMRSPLHVFQLGAWLLVLFATPVTAVYSLLRRARGDEVPTFVFCAPFLALTALIVEIEVYLLWGLPAVLVAILFILARQTEGRARVWGLILAFLLLLAFINSAVGKPVWAQERRDFVLTPWGNRPPLVYLGGRANLNLPPRVADFYRRTVEFIQSQVGEQETIFSFPYHAEWYFLANRKNPTRYIVPSQDAADEQGMALMEEQLRLTRPKLILYYREDIFNTPYTRKLRQRLDDGYHKIRDENGYEFLLRNE